MSNPEPQGFPQSSPRSGANWPFTSSQGQAAPGQEPAPAFPAPATPPAQNVPQYSQHPVQSSQYPLAGGTPLPAAAKPALSQPDPAFANPELAQPQPVATGNPLPAAQPASAPVEQLSVSPVSDPLPEDRSVEDPTGETPIADSQAAASGVTEPDVASEEVEKDTGSAAKGIQESLHQQALTPWWLDCLMALSLAGVMVFNGFGMSMWLRIGSLIVMVIALILLTWYQGDAQEKSNTFLTATLLGVVCGFLAGLIVVAASLYMVAPIPAWYPWVLWLVSGVLLFLTYRGFRDWVIQNLQKKSHRKSTK